MTDKSYKLYCQGKELLDKKNYEKAIEKLVRSYQIDRHYATCHALGVAYRALRDMAGEGINFINYDMEAVEYFREAYEQNPNSDKACYDLAYEFSEKKYFDDSLHLLEKVLKRNPTHGPSKKLYEKIKDLFQ